MQRTERRDGSIRRPAAVMVAAILAGNWAPAGQLAANPARPALIHGSVVKADGLTAVPGASVKAAHLRTGTVYSSAPTGADGFYRIGGLPSGSYDLAVEMPEGLYAADLVVEAEAGETNLVSLALRPRASADPQEGAPPEDEEPKPEEPKPEEPPKAEEGDKQEGQQEGEPEPQQKEKKRRKGGSFFRSPWGAAVSIVVGSGLVGAAANSVADDDTDESAMTESGN